MRPASSRMRPAAGEVAFLAGVAGCREREQLAVERQARPQHGHRLDRLQGRAWIESRLDVTDLQLHLTVGAEDDDGPVVDALDDPAAHQVRDGRVRGFADRWRVRERTAVHGCVHCFLHICILHHCVVHASAPVDPVDPVDVSLAFGGLAGHLAPDAVPARDQGPGDQRETQHGGAAAPPSAYIRTRTEARKASVTSSVHGEPGRR